MMATWLEEAGTQLRGVMDAFLAEIQQQGFLPLLRPVAPFNQPAFLAPAVTVGGVLALTLLSGVAIGALGTLALALIAFYLLLVQVFGVTVEIHPFGR
jgi:hypothetical protein